jgi:hypothetical protein
MKAWKVIGFVVFSISAADASAQGWDGLLDRVGDRLGRRVEDRLSGTSESATDKVFDKADHTVGCAAGDRACGVKCVATDVGCLKNAQAQGHTVQIVTEDQLEIRRCSSSDTACLERASKAGKKVEITD